MRESGPPAASWDRTVAARRGSSVLQMLHQWPKNSSTVGRPELPPVVLTSTVPEPFTRAAVKEGTGSPGCGTPDFLGVPMEVKSPIPSATAATSPTTRKILRGRRGGRSAGGASGVATVIGQAT